MGAEDIIVLIKAFRYIDSIVESEDVYEYLNERFERIDFDIDLLNIILEYMKIPDKKYQEAIEILTQPNVSAVSIFKQLKNCRKDA